ncbi:MAG: AsmA-like C-terminal region-containing protein [Flavobacteriaceae bacterium]
MNKKKLKKSILKKVLKWFIGTVLVLIILLATAPYLFKDKIKQMVESSINDNINATVSFDDLDLSFFRSFPKADVVIKNTKIINKASFEGDTLFYADELHLKMKLTEVFKSAEETMQLSSISVANSKVSILVNKNGITNYDIAVKKEFIGETSKESSFSLGIENYTVENLNFIYYDASSQMKMSIDSIYHSGSGNFKESVLDLDTHTKALVSIEMNTVNYMNKLAVSMDAIIEMDINNSKYTFKENKGYINQLPLEFNGFIQLVGNKGNQLYDVSFKTPTSSFKNLLAILPAQYSGNLENVQTKGDFETKGVIKGTLSETTIPNFDISFLSKDAMFQYPDLPKSVQNIHINSRIMNTTGNLNDTEVEINQLDFTIDKDAFSAKGSVSNIEKNPKINIKAKGVINLDNVAKAYPISLDQQFSGILKADVSSVFDMNSIDKKQYQNIKNAGSISLNEFKYDGKDIAKPFLVNKTSISFNTNSIKLNEFKAKTGDSDIDIKGDLENFYGFLFKGEVLKGDFSLNSNLLKISDFMVASETTSDETVSKEVVKIPAFLDCTFTATAKKVIYDNINLSTVAGKLIVKDEAIDLQNLNMNAFGGLIKLNGKVSTKKEIADFNMNLSLENVSIEESFSQLEMLQSIAPISSVIGGKMNSSIKLSGDLLKNLTPNLKTLSGDLLSLLFDTKLKANDSQMLSYLGNEVTFIDVKKLDFEKIKTQISFKNGGVTVKPFNLKYKDIAIEVGGIHSFDQSMDYNLTFNVPAKYLGNEVAGLISKFSKKEQKEIGSIPVTAKLTGSFTNPKLQTDIKKVTSEFTNKLVKRQKDKLVDKGKDKLFDLLKKKKGVKKDSTNKVKDVLNGLFKKKKKKNK